MHGQIMGMIRRFRLIWRSILYLAISLILVLFAAVFSRVMAADYTVVGCDIATAISSANGSAGNRVLIPEGTCTLTAQLPTITQPMTIEGQGAGAVIDAVNTNKRVLRIASTTGGAVNLTRLTIKNGMNTIDPSTSDMAGALGGGISWDAGGGTLTINSCTINSNATSLGNGGGIAAYDSMANGSAKLVITNSTISNNTATIGVGGGIFVGQKVDLVMSGTTVTGNKAGATAANFGQGGGLFLFGPAGATGSSITGGTFSNNSASGDGGAIYTTAPIAITTTYSGNTVGADGNGPNLWNNSDGVFLLPTDASPTISAGGTATFTEHDLPVVIDSSVAIGDSDNANLAKATVTISAGFIAKKDILVFAGLTETDGTVTAKANGSITGSYDDTTGILTLQGVATREKYQAALEIVKFKNDTHYLPITSTPRTISFVVNDGKNDSSAATSTVNVNGVNDAPVLAPATPMLAGITEDDTANAGQTVASIIATTTITVSTITDLDYNPINDPAVGVRGIAVIDAAPGNGTWQYSLDNGSNWLDFGTVAATSALLLRSTDYVRFLPDGKNGTSASFIYRAWDQSDGAAAGSKENAGTLLAGANPVCTGSGTGNGGATAFSIGCNSASITVTSVNDPPVFIAGATNLTIHQNSDAVDIKGLLHVSDPDSGQTEVWTVTGSPSHGALSGFPATASSGLNIVPGGTVTYAPAAGYVGNDSFTVRVSDGIAAASRTITVAVVAPPAITKSFGAATIPLNGTTTLTFTITNPNASVTLNGLGFTDTLPAGLVVAPTPTLSNDCGGTATAASGSGSVSLSGGTLVAGAPCTVSVIVQGTTSGLKNNSVTVASTEGSTGNTATASISVIAPATHFTVSAPATATSGAAFNFTVTALDQFNNTVTGYTGTVHFTSSDGLATLPADATLTNGVGTFPAILKSVGNQTIMATDTLNATITGTSGAIQIFRQSITADFNGDGKNDILWRDSVSGQTIIWLMDGTIHTGDVPLGIVPVSWEIVGVGDFNGDGKPDILWRDSTTGQTIIWLMDKTTHTGDVSLGSVPVNWEVDGVGDFNDDGRPDILWRDSTTGQNVVWYMNGITHTGDGSVPSVPTNWKIVGVDDFNADGKPDILWRDTTTGQIVVWYMDGVTHTGDGAILSPPENWEIDGASDFNGDGKPDIVWRDTVSGQIIIWLMDGTTHIGDASLGSVPVNWEIVGSGDFNGDGKSDNLWRDSESGQIIIWLMDGTTHTGDVSLGSAPTNRKIEGVNDFNGDGKPDIIWRDSDTGQIIIWLMDGTTHTGDVSLGTVPMNWQIVGAAGFNNNGKADILWRDSTTGQIIIWLMDGTTHTGDVSLGSVPVNWKIVGVGDFNGDGKSDILWRDTTTGQNVVWYMDGSTHTGDGSIQSVPVNWEITGTGDFNGNGKPDIIWRDSTTGQIVIWLMDGVTHTGDVSLGSVPTNWKIVGM